MVPGCQRALHGAVVRQPAGTGGGGAHQFGRAGIGQVTQPVGDRVDAGGGGQLVDIAFMRKRVGQGRDAAQPARPQDGRHVVDGDALVGVGIGRHGGAVAHLEGLGHGGLLAGQQQRQRGRAVAGVAGLEVIAGGRAVGVQAAAHPHQLRRALGLPGKFLFATELHPHRPAHRA